MSKVVQLHRDAGRLSHVDQLRATRAHRLAVADQIIATGGNLSRFAEAIGVAPCTALKYLRAHDPERLAALVSGRGLNQLDVHTATCRLLLVRSFVGIRGGHGRLAKALGISSAALSCFVKTWAPDGIDQALDDLLPDWNVEGMA
jgi:hypothetical protein